MAVNSKIAVEKDQPGQPHRGKVFVAIHAHLDDVPYFAGGLCAKLMKEGYTGYIVRTGNDEKYGGHTIAENILNNEQQHLKMAQVLGFKDVFDLYYRSHRMNEISPVEIRGRLIFILRMLKADTVISFDPSSSAENDGDHAATARTVEDACAMCGSPSDFAEHLEAGFPAHPVRERYYFHARPEQRFNRVVDIGPHLEKKIDAIVECKSQGGGALGSELRARLAYEASHDATHVSPNGRPGGGLAAGGHAGRYRENRTDEDHADRRGDFSQGSAHRRRIRQRQ